MNQAVKAEYLSRSDVGSQILFGPFGQHRSRDQRQQPEYCNHCQDAAFAHVPVYRAC
jgi:hypothetical protein